CAGGTCQGTAIACNDGNPCTDDACNPVTGCTTTPNSVACSDGSVCTQGDYCAGGTCQPGGAIVCTDTDPCTQNGCDPAAGCTVQPASGAPCDDGDACTVADECLNGSCISGSPRACDD